LAILCQTGAKALSGKPEFIEGKIFEGVSYDRNITGKGTLIQIYDPAKDMSTPPYWEYEDENREETHDVPAGHKVRVVTATIKFI
jgi:hypothetical protein